MLRQELARKGWRGENIALGTATDPYQPIEGRYRLTRGILEALRDFRNPVSIVTKGTLVKRDIDVLAELARVADCSVAFTVTTLDEELWRKLEPGTPPPLKRLRVMRELVRAGVRAGVLLAPVIPGLTTEQGRMDAVLAAAAEHEARFLGARTLYLKPGVKEWFLQFVHQEFPQLDQLFEHMYPGAYAPRADVQAIDSRVQALKQRFGLAERLMSGKDQPQPIQLRLLAS